MKSADEKFDRAENLFTQFHGFPPVRGDVVAVNMRQPEPALIIGQLLYVGYIALNEKTPYMHKFTKHRPLLASSSDGRQLYILKGGYRFTPRGIT